MNKQIKNLISVVMIALLLAACAPFETTPAPVEVPEMIVTEAPTGAPEPVVISEPTEDIPAATPSDGVVPEDFSQYIGLRYPPSPAGLSLVFSMLIQDSDLYSLSMVIDGIVTGCRMRLFDKSYIRIALCCRCGHNAMIPH